MLIEPINYNLPLYRPPSEARSLLVQVTLGCSHNKCTYCNMYRSKQYQVREVASVCNELERAKDYYEAAGITPRKVFLCDGDALAAPMDTLIAVVDKINELFPSLKRIGIYATAQNVLDKSEKELTELAEKKLSIGYIGMESGCDKVLHSIVKGNTAADMSEAFSKLKRTGWQLSIIAMLGIGGREYTTSHREETAKLISASVPDFFSFLTTVAVPGTPYERMVKKGKTTPLTTLELLEEMRDILAGINCSNGNIFFRANHVSNQFPLSGILPRDKKQLVATINQWIASCPGGTYPEIHPSMM